MATFYWVGGTGVWSNSAKWSLTSGGAGGAGVPTSTDDAVIDSNSGSGNWQMGSFAFNCRNLTITSTASLTQFEQTGANPNTANTINLYGDLTVSKTYFFANSIFGNKNIRIVAYKSGSQTINASGGATNEYIALTVKSGSTTIITSSFSFGSLVNTNERNLIVETGGTLTLQASMLGCYAFTCNTGATLNFAGSSSAYFSFQNSFIVSSGATVNYTNGAFGIVAYAIGPENATFSGGGKSYPQLSFEQAYSVAYPTTSYASLTFNDADTFALLSVTLSIYTNMRFILAANINVTFSFRTFTSVTVYTEPYRIYLQSSSLSVPRTLTAGSTFRHVYLVVQDITAAGAIPFTAFTTDKCVNNGGNTNWNFGAVGFPILLQ